MADKEKKGKELEELYHKTMKELNERVDRAKTWAECRRIRADFRAQRDKLIAEDPELYKRFMGENSKLYDFLDEKAEELGGPMAPRLFRFSTHYVYRGDEPCDKEKKRDELEELYEKTVKGLNERVNRANSIEECRRIRADFWTLRDKLIAEGSELYRRLRKENSKFYDLLNGKVEALGGPMSLRRFVDYHKVKGDEIDDKGKKRNELEELYHKTMKGLYERVEAAKTMEDCRNIAVDFRALSDKLIAEDPELYKHFREENLRFDDALNGKVEELGGPLAPMH